MRSSRIRRRRRSCSPTPSASTPAFDRKLLFFYEEVGKLLEASLVDGQERGIVAAGDARVFAIMTLGAVKEIMYQVVMRGLDYPEERIVAEIFRFLAAGYLRVTPP